MDIPAWLTGLGLARHAPAFSEERITAEVLPDLTDEDLRALGVAALGERKTLLAAAAALRAERAPDYAPEIHPLEPLITSWPSILALPLREYVEERHPVLELWHACDVVELTLRFLVMIGVADAARDGQLPEALARQFWERVERPELGKWRGMAEAVAQALDPHRALAPEIASYVAGTLVPLLDGTAKPRTAETSFSALRNTLAHAGGVTRAGAARLLALWRPRFEEAMRQGAWLGELSLVVRQADGSFALLRGPSARPATLPATERAAVETLAPPPGAVLVARGERALPLWPMALYGEPLSPDRGPTGIESTPQVYTRRGEVRLEYTPLGSDGACQSVGDDAGLEAFRRVFRLELHRRETAAAGFTVPGFEEQIRKNADALVGRAGEIETLGALVRETREGVLWLSGPAGVGKSFLLARVAFGLLDEAEDDRLVLAYRFKLGDDRCRRDSFLRFAVERLERWLQAESPGEDPTGDARRQTPPLDRLRALLDRLPRHRRVVFLLDGLDEIAAAEESGARKGECGFAQEIPLALRRKGVLWVCAGRPERGLPEAFAAAGATEPFPAGLPRMSESDIRTMLLEKIGPLRKRLLRADREEGDRVVNPFVERVARNAEGLPIYVKYVVGDVLSGRVSPEPGAPLPPSLAKYHEELLRLCAVGDLHQLLTPLAATLAVAREPLTPEELAALLARRTVLSRPGPDAVARVRQGLAAIASMVALAPDPDGGDGYTLWHHSLREHMLVSPTMTEAIATARQALAEAALRPAGDDAARYLYRQGITHLLETSRRDEALALMTDPGYVLARLETLPGDGGRDGLATDWCAWLLPSKDLQELQQAAENFYGRLGDLCQAAAAGDEVEPLRTVQELLLWSVTPKLEVRLGGGPALRAAAVQTLSATQSLLEREPDNTTFLRDLSVSYEKLGDLNLRTDPTKARAWIEKSLAIRERLVALEPNNTESLHDLSVSYSWFGGLDLRTSSAKARTWFEKSLTIRERLVALEPDNSTFLRDLSVSYNWLGDLDLRTDSAKAREWFEKALVIREWLVALEPDNTTFLRGLSLSYNKLGGLDLRTDPAKARAWFEKDLAIAESLNALEPDNWEFLRDLSVSYNWLGSLDLQTDPARARAWFEKSLEIAERLGALEPDNTTFLRDLSLSYNRFGGLDLRTHPARARSWFEKRLAVAERLGALEPDNWEFLRDLSVSYNWLGSLDLRTDPAKAREWFEKGLAIAERLGALEPDNTTFLRDLSVSYNKLGDLDQRTDPVRARAWFEKGLEIAERLVALEPDNTTFLRDLALSYTRLGGIDLRTDPAKAREWFEKRLAVAESLNALEPDNWEFLRDLSVSYNRLGNLDLRTDSTRARAWFEKGFAIAERLSELEPDNWEFLRDLSVSYNWLGSLDLRTDPARARAWFEKGLEIAERLGALDPDNTTFLRDLSLSYNRLGGLDLRTHPARARAWFEKRLAVAERLGALEPDNWEFLRDLSVSYNWLGSLDLRTDPARARAWFEKGLEIAERLGALDPDNTTFLRDLSLSHIRLGSIDRRTDPAKARAWFEKGLAISERLVALESDNIDFLRDLSVSYDRLGGLDLRTDTAKAREWVEKSLKIRERLAALEPDNTTFLRDLSVSYNTLGGLDQRTDPAKARAWFEKSLVIAERLAALEPDNIDFLRDLSVSHNRLGGLDLRTDPAKAREWFEKGFAIAERLAALEPDNNTFLRDLSLSYSWLGTLDLRTDPATAREGLEKSLAIRERLVALEPENSEFLRDLSISDSRLGDLDLQTDPARAREWFRKSLTIAERLVALEPDNTTFLRDLSVYFYKLGDLDLRTDLTKAREWSEKSLAIRERLAALEPDNTAFLRDLLASYNKLGQLDARTDSARAREWFEKSLAAAQRLCALDDSMDSQLSLSMAYQDMGECIAESADPRARGLFEEGLRIRRRLVQDDPENAELWSRLGSAAGPLAVWARDHQEPDAAALRDEAEAAFARAAELDPSEPSIPQTLAAVRACLGEPEAALAALETAFELGLDDADELAQDDDFASLRGLARFEELLQRMRERRAMGDTAGQTTP